MPRKKCGKRHDLVCVWWVDADQTSGWSEDDENEKIHVMATYGLLIRKDRVFVHVADTHLHGSTWGGRNRIPRAWIRKVEVIKKDSDCHYFEDPGK